MRNFQDTFKTRKRSFISAFSIRMTVPLMVFLPNILKYYSGDLLKNILRWGDTGKRQKQPLEVFCKKGILKNFTNFTGKHLYSNLFLIKLRLQKRGFNTGVFL